MLASTPKSAPVLTLLGLPKALASVPETAAMLATSCDGVTPITVARSWPAATDRSKPLMSTALLVVAIVIAAVVVVRSAATLGGWNRRSTRRRRYR